MNTEITPKTATPPQKASVVSALAAKLECDPQKLVPMLKKTAFANCNTDEEFMAMCMVANTYGLNPILKEVYAFPSKGGQVVPIVSVDGWIKLMNSHPAFDGVEFEEDKDRCTAIVYRKDRAHPIKATEWLAECIGNTEPWRRWPRRMLRHKALIQGARIAFGFAGIYDEDEGRRIAEVTEVNVASDGPLDGARTPPTANTDKLRATLGLENTSTVEQPKTTPTDVSSPEGIDTPSKAKKPAKAPSHASTTLPEDLPL